MLTDYDAWKSTLQRAIAHLFDLEYPGLDGRRETAPSEYSFVEALRHLYQECQFPDFLAWAAWRQAGISPAAAEELQALKTLLDAYDEPETTEDLWADPHWHTIRQQADQALNLLKH